jgi:uncharacterized damage-inducible protein DinB
MVRLPVAVALAVSVAPLFAQDPAKLKAEFLANFDDTAKKIVSLAEAVPADKYKWRPAPGVRSISEVYMHITGANFMIPNFLGAKMPEDLKLGRDSEKTITSKDEIIPLLKRAMEHTRRAIESGMDTPDKATKLFGRDSTNAGVALLLITHMHEHLGQSIAYARSNGVTPPWSEGGR